MAILPIVTGATQSILHKKTERVSGVTKDVKKLIKDMKQTLVDAQGLGLAAPQIDKSVRICLAIINGRTTVLINPDIIWKSEDIAMDEEGCLSLPGIYLKIRRPKSILVEYLSEDGEQQERQLSGMDARVVQHEVDHLDGVLIVDPVHSNP